MITPHDRGQDRYLVPACIHAPFRVARWKSWLLVTRADLGRWHLTTGSSVPDFPLASSHGLSAHQGVSSLKFQRVSGCAFTNRKKSEPRPCLTLHDQDSYYAVTGRYSFSRPRSLLLILVFPRCHVGYPKCLVSSIPTHRHL